MNVLLYHEKKKKELFGCYNAGNETFSHFNYVVMCEIMIGSCVCTASCFCVSAFGENVLLCSLGL